MGKFTKIPENTFQKLQMNAGVLSTQFDVENGSVEEQYLVGATSGGISFSAIPSFTDEGADIDNCPKNTKELKKLEDWEIGLSGTFVTVDSANARKLIAAADVSENGIIPRKNLKDEDFIEELWWVGDYGNSDGFVAIKMSNALSTGGFSIQTTDAAKGAFSFDFTAHYSINDPDQVPFEVYISEGGDI